MATGFDGLTEEVITPGYCLACGACVASCPIKCLSAEEEGPVLKGNCVLKLAEGGVEAFVKAGYPPEAMNFTNCDICYRQCPQVIDRKGLEPRIFGRRSSEEEVLGIYQRAFSVQARSPDIKLHAQDGGAVTAILASLLMDGSIDAAIVMGVGASPWRPLPKIVTTREELIECAGTKYARGAVFLGLSDAVDLYYHSRIAVVGTPCQIAAFRWMQFSSPANRHLGDAIKLCIGLFCMHAFEYQKLFVNFIERELRIPLYEVAKFDIKKGQFIVYPRHKPKQELSLESVEKYVYFPCQVCLDFTSELADLSVGAIGSPLGRSTVLVRTQRGSDALDTARRFDEVDVLELEKVKPGLSSIEKIAKKKKLNAREQLGKLERLNKPPPSWMKGPPPREMPLPIAQL